MQRQKNANEGSGDKLSLKAAAALHITKMK